MADENPIRIAKASVKSVPWPWALAILMVVFLTAGWVLAGNLVHRVPALDVAAGRTLSSCVVISLIAVAFSRTRHDSARVLRRWPAVLRLSFVGFFLYYTGTLLGTARLGAAEAGLVVSLLPCFTFLIGLLIRAEKPVISKLAGTVVATAAAMVYALVGGNGSSGASGSVLFGLALAAGGTVAYAGYGYLYRFSMSDLSPIAALPAITAAGAAMLFPLAAAFTPIGHIRLHDWMLIGVLGAGLTAPVFVIAHELIRTKGPLFAASFALVVPFTIRLTEWLLGRAAAPSPGTLGLLVLSAAGVWATISSRSPLRRSTLLVRRQPQDSVHTPPVGPALKDVG
jgi:drug/metabolite transporter (DMT)-like permease